MRGSIRSSADFTRALKEGKRLSGRLLVLNIRAREESGPVRFGLIVTKRHGGAVSRNLLRRRLRSLLSTKAFPPGSDVVVGARGAASEASFQDLARELDELTRN